jgi:hypothetical protein
MAPFRWRLGVVGSIRQDFIGHHHPVCRHFKAIDGAATPSSAEEGSSRPLMTLYAKPIIEEKLSTAGGIRE